MEEITQGTPEWHDIKRWNLGANDCASILGFGFREPWDLLDDKISGVPYVPTEPHVTERMRMGTEYESLARISCARRHNVDIRVPGLRRHRCYSWLTASPDGETPAMLYEFKVRQKTGEHVPIKYWIQVQIQMEVWDVNYCLYCESRIEDGILVEWREWKIERNQAWFREYFPLIQRFWDAVRHPGTKRKRKANAVHDTFTRPRYSNLSNFLLKDCLLDWLTLFGDKTRKESDSALSALVSQQRARFRERVFRKLESSWGISVEDALPSWHRCYDPLIAPDEYISQERKIYIGCQRTKTAMEGRCPYIFNACLLDSVNRGVHVDVLVHGHYISTIYDSMPLGDRYYPLLIEYSTLRMASDRKHLLNVGKQPAYKGRLWQAADALGCSLGFVIGRKYVSAAGTVESCMESIGVADFRGYDSEITALCLAGNVWLDELERMKGEQEELDDSRLYPNMKNRYDYPWHSLKLARAIDILEVTRMYRCGPGIRKQATTWAELRQMPENIQTFVDANINKRQVNRMPPVSYDANCAYIDFETITNVYDSFRNFPLAEDNSMIFMIGALLQEGERPVTFTAGSMTVEEEGRIVNELWHYLKSNGITRVFHWGHAEKTYLSRRHATFLTDFLFVDLCEIFQQSRFALPGMFNYKLKDMCAALEITWPSGGPADGLDAMALAIQAYLGGQAIPQCIKDYNAMDCMALRQITLLANNLTPDNVPRL